MAARRAADALHTDPAISTASGRLASATDLVLSGGVTVHADGTATVKNDSRTYEITDACSCADAHHRSKWCKHVLAVVLWKRATVCLAKKTVNKRPEKSGYSRKSTI